MPFLEQQLEFGSEKKADMTTEQTVINNVDAFVEEARKKFEKEEDLEVDFGSLCMIALKDSRKDSDPLAEEYCQLVKSVGDKLEADGIKYNKNSPLKEAAEEVLSQTAQRKFSFSQRN